MDRLIGGVMVALVLAFIGIEAVVGFSFGKSMFPADSGVNMMSVIGVMVPATVAVAGYLAMRAFRQRIWQSLLASCLIITVCSAYLITSNVGYSATVRAASENSQHAKSTLYADTHLEVASIRAEIDALPQHRPADAVLADLSRFPEKPRSRRDRNAVADLKAELAVANRAVELRNKLDIERDALRLDVAPISDTTPQITAIANATTLDRGVVETALVWGLPVLVLVITMLGLTAAQAIGPVHVSSFKPPQHDVMPPESPKPEPVPAPESTLQPGDVSETATVLPMVRSMTNGEIERVRAVLEANLRECPSAFVATDDITRMVNTHLGSDFNSRQVGAVLGGLGFERFRHQGKRGFIDLEFYVPETPRLALVAAA